MVAASSRGHGLAARDVVIAFVEHTTWRQRIGEQLVARPAMFAKADDSQSFVRLITVDT